MSKVEIKHPDKAISTGAYSAAILSGDWLFVSGHAAEDLKTGELLGRSKGEQTREALRSIGKVLAEGGASFADVVKATCHLADIREFEAFDSVYAEFFPPPPASSHHGSVDVAGRHSGRD
jgi:2-iminobutanoate/2-iminopropanoate deaminase